MLYKRKNSNELSAFITSAVIKFVDLKSNDCSESLLVDLNDLIMVPSLQIFVFVSARNFKFYILHLHFV